MKVTAKAELLADLAALTVGAALGATLSGLPAAICLMATLIVSLLFAVVLVAGQQARADHAWVITMIAMGGLGVGLGPTTGQLLYMWIAHARHLPPSHDWGWAGMGWFWTFQSFWWLTLPPQHPSFDQRWRTGLGYLAVGALMWAVFLLNRFG